jgi:4-diphosphocytidyl-2-C-methyl-D-erythritol kinase
VTDPLRRLTPVVRLAPAKLNLTLAVVGRRPDGYHDLHSVMAPLELADRLSLLPTTGSDDRLHVSGLAAGPDGENLVLRAVSALRDRLGGTTELPGAAWNPRPFLPALAIRLEKRIPVAAGLGGGSSDAAAAIDGALEAWGADLDTDARLSVALGIGSDVPFFLAGRAAVVSGRGESVTPVVGVTGAPPGILLVTLAMPVPTGAVFAALAAGARAPAGSTRVTSQHLAGELQRGITAAALHDRAGILASANDLAAATAIVVPEMVAFRRALMRALNRPVGQSGSGPTLWVLYPSGDDAAAAADRVLAALAAGTLVAPGDAPPAVIATRLAAEPAPIAQGATE